MWNLAANPTHPELTILPFPNVEANSLESLMLPKLTQCVRKFIMHQTVRLCVYTE